MSLPPTYWLNQCRAELAAARARCCSHGVVRERCREDHPTEIEETADE